VGPTSAEVSQENRKKEKKMLYQATTLAAKTLLALVVFMIVNHLVKISTMSFMNSVLNVLFFGSNACILFIFNKFVFFYISIYYSKIVGILVKFCSSVNTNNF